MLLKVISTLRFEPVPYEKTANSVTAGGKHTESNPVEHSVPASQGPNPKKPQDPEPPAATEPTAASVLASRLTLRTTMMWVISVLVLIGAGLLIGATPKIGALYFAALLVISGTARLALPGTPFGLAARQKFMDAAFCYLLAAAIIILTNSAHALK